MIIIMIAFCAMMLSYVANYEMIIPIMCVSAPKKPHMQKPDKFPLTLSGFFICLQRCRTKINHNHHLFCIKTIKNNKLRS
ncbi:hypothetical protein EU660_21145 [Escherichia coli]|nr:hypothetical protein [Escherichia coli]